MGISINQKISDLPSRDKYKFWSQLDLILNDRYHSAQYGLMGEDYASLPVEKLQEAKEKLYNKLFRSNKKNKSLENN